MIKIQSIKRKKIIRKTYSLKKKKIIILSPPVKTISKIYNYTISTIKQHFLLIHI